MSWKKGKGGDSLTSEQSDVLGRWRYNSATDELTTSSTVKANLNSFILGENGHGIHSAGEQLVVQNRRSLKNYVPVWTEMATPTNGTGPYNVTNKTYGRDYSGSGVVVWGSITPAYATPATTNVQDFQVYLDSASNNDPAANVTIYRVKIAVRESGATDVAVNFPIEYVVYAGGSYSQQVVREVFNCQRSNTTQTFTFKAPFDLKKDTDTKVEVWVLNSKFERVRLLNVLGGVAPNGRRWVDCQIQYSTWVDREMAYAFEGVGASMAFGIKSVNGGTIEQNGTYLLNNWDVNSMVVITVDPRVDFIKLKPWDGAQSPTQYSEVKLPVNAAGTGHITIRYMTNNPVSLYRHKNGSSPYNWYLNYDGYSYVKGLGGTADYLYELKAGKQHIRGSVAILQINGTTSSNIDDWIKMRMVTSNNGATLDASLQLRNTETRSAVHQYINQNVTSVSRVIGNMTNSTTSFPIDSTSTDGEIAYIDTVIHSTSDGSGDWKYKYKGRFTHHNNNNYYYSLERELNPEYIT